MATKLVQPASQVLPPVPRITKIITSHKSFLAIHPWTRNTRIDDGFMPIHITKVAEKSSGLVGDNKEMEQHEKDSRTVSQIKEDLYQAVEGINRGIFGIPSAKKSEIHGLVELLESQNPTPDPTLNLDKVDGCWKLLYSTITILGSKRTKLGLRDFISLGDFFQKIDVSKLTIEASFKTSSNSRVEISFENSTITPHQLMNMFRKNYDLLLGIFNPEGWLEITYVDDNLRIGRDDNGNIFVLERS